MAAEKVLAILNQYSANELYKELYWKRPEVFEQPIRSWGEFCARFRGGVLRM